MQIYIVSSKEYISNISQPKMETGIPKVSLHQTEKYDLGLTPFKITNAQRLTRKDALRDTCQFRRKTSFTNKKIFKLQALNNKQNGRIYMVNLYDIREKGHSEKSKFPFSAMVSTGISKLGTTYIHTVTSGAKINSAYKCNEVSSHLLREMEQLSVGDYIF